MSEKEMGVASGAMQGAQAGAAFGPWGMAIGAIVGGIAGASAGGDARRARIYANRAKKTERMMGYFEAAVQRREMIRQARIARAESVAAISAGGEGGLQSSGGRGALSSISSQTNFNLRYFDARIRDYIKMQEWIDKAGKRAASAANMQGLMDITASAFSAFGSMGMGGGSTGLSDPGAILGSQQGRHLGTIGIQSTPITITPARVPG